MPRNDDCKNLSIGCRVQYHPTTFQNALTPFPCQWSQLPLHPSPRLEQTVLQFFTFRYFPTQLLVDAFCIFNHATEC